jgi:hypothetical protein
MYWMVLHRPVELADLRTRGADEEEIPLTGSPLR